MLEIIKYKYIQTKAVNKFGASESKARDKREREKEERKGI